MKKIFVLFGVAIISCSTPKRSQEPVSVSYHSEEVSFKSSDGDLSLSGTLTSPRQDRLSTAVILISGSGPDNRDYENQFGHKPFLVLADNLTRIGIAVLRYDERGVGRSAGNYREASYANLIADAFGGVKYLRENGFQKVGVIGHSEGGGIAPNVPADFYVLMGADNVPADVSLRYQTKSRLQYMEVSDAVQRQILTNLDQLLAIVKSEDDPAVARTKTAHAIAEASKHTTEEYQRVASRLGDPEALVEGFLDPKFMWRLRHDPKDQLRKLRKPVLVLFGEDDHLLNVPEALPAMEHALDSTTHEIKIFPGVGHLFMKDKGVPMEKLHALEETIAPEVMEKIGDWIQRQ